MTSAEITRFVELRDRLSVADEALIGYDNEIVACLRGISGHLASNNFGLAADAVAELLSELRHDYGAQDFTPMHDRHVEAVVARRAARPSAGS